jgi:tRNA A-37 threonylcarbamoyl transferase component Bud32
MNPEEPLHFGSYEVLPHPEGGHWLLGEGEYGKTYRAKHRFLRRNCALKIIHERHMRDDGQRARFLQEAQTAASLQHEGIAQIYDFGEQEGAFYYAMEFCEGGSLEELASRVGPMPWSQVAEFGRQIGRALACAHGSGLLHRDLKPQNIMLRDPGEPWIAKLIDFGLVKILAKGDSDSTVAVMSREGGFKGNYATASPEQTSEEVDLDERSDLFSLGVTLWWLLVGRNPFDGVSRPQLISDRLSSKSYEPELPQGLDPDARRIIAKLLEKRPDERYARAEQLLEDLRAHTASDGSSSTSTSSAGEGAAVVAAEPEAAAVPVFESTFDVVSVVDETAYGKLYRCVDGAGHSYSAFFPAEEVPGASLDAMRAICAEPVSYPCLDLFGEWTTEAGQPVFIISSLEGMRLLDALKRFGPARLVDMAPFLGRLAWCRDALQSRSEVAVEMNPLYLRVAPRDGGDRASSWKELEPETLRTLPRLKVDELADSSSAASATVVSSEADFAPGVQFPALIYRLLSGIPIKHAAFFTSAAYVPVSALSEDANLLLERVISGEETVPGAIELLRKLAALEGLSFDHFEVRLPTGEVADVEDDQAITIDLSRSHPPVIRSEAGAPSTVEAQTPPALPEATAEAASGAVGQTSGVALPPPPAEEAPPALPPEPEPEPEPVGTSLQPVVVEPGVGRSLEPKPARSKRPLVIAAAVVIGVLAVGGIVAAVVGGGGGGDEVANHGDPTRGPKDPPPPKSGPKEDPEPEPVAETPRQFAVMLSTSPADAMLSGVRDAEDRSGVVSGRAAEGKVAFEFAPTFPLTLLIEADGYEELERSIPEAAIREGRYAGTGTIEMAAKAAEFGAPKLALETGERQASGDWLVVEAAEPSALEVLSESPLKWRAGREAFPLSVRIAVPGYRERVVTWSSADEAVAAAEADPLILRRATGVLKFASSGVPDCQAASVQFLGPLPEAAGLVAAEAEALSVPMATTGVERQLPSGRYRVDFKVPMLPAQFRAFDVELQPGQDKSVPVPAFSGPYQGKGPYATASGGELQMDYLINLDFKNARGSIVNRARFQENVWLQIEFGWVPDSRPVENPAFLGLRWTAARMFSAEDAGGLASAEPQALSPEKNPDLRGRLMLDLGELARGKVDLIEWVTDKGDISVFADGEGGVILKRQ